MKSQKEQEGVINKHLVNTEIADVFSLLFFLLGKRQVFSPLFLFKIVKAKDFH